MNLVIDQGNTKAKVAIFNREQLIMTEEVVELTFSRIDSLKKQYGIHHCILSTVKPLATQLLEYLQHSFGLFLHLNADTLLPVKIGYKTPQTLGADRVAAVVGAAEQIGREAVIVIDAGTAITYDFMDETGVFEGGNIAPGIHLRMRALRDFTGKLPYVNPEGDTPLIGYSTETAIRSGVINGICFEIEGFIAKIKATHPS
ncbi:MAG: type III pantothenate kinase, partial [Bacteroidales bacterium]